MEYILVSTENTLANGPTVCGDADSDPELMAACGAKLVQPLGITFTEYVSPYCPRKVLNVLATHGFRVVASSGAGQTCVWTLERAKA